MVGDDEGRRYIDGASGIVVAILGQGVTRSPMPSPRWYCADAAFRFTLGVSSS